MSGQAVVVAVGCDIRLGECGADVQTYFYLSVKVGAVDCDGDAVPRAWSAFVARICGRLGRVEDYLHRSSRSAVRESTDFLWLS